MDISIKYRPGEIILLNEGDTSYDRIGIVIPGNTGWQEPYDSAHPWVPFRSINLKTGVVPETGVEKVLTREYAENLVLEKLHDDDVKYNFVKQMEKAVLKHKRRGDLALALVRDSPQEITKDA